MQKGPSQKTENGFQDLLSLNAGLPSLSYHLSLRPFVNFSGRLRQVLLYLNLMFEQGPYVFLPAVFSKHKGASFVSLFCLYEVICVFSGVATISQLIAL